VPLRFRPRLGRELELGALGVHRDPAGEVPQPADVVPVQVADRDGVNGRDVDARLVKGLVQRLARAGDDRPHRGIRVEPAAQRGVGDQRGVKTGVEQQPAAVGLEQHAGNGEPYLLVRIVPHEHMPRHVDPAERQRDDASHSGHARSVRDLAAVRTEP
jgi:hypothetical protein